MNQSYDLMEFIKLPLGNALSVPTTQFPFKIHDEDLLYSSTDMSFENGELISFGSVLDKSTG